MSGTNTYSGTTINGGTLKVSADANLGTAPGSTDTDNIILGGGTLNTTASFTLNTNRGITLTGNSSINVNSSTTLTYAGVIADNASTYNITKSGSGSLALSGTHTYDGDTTISAGTIVLTGALNTLTDLVVASGATFDLQVPHTFASLDLDGTISRSAGTSTLTISGTSAMGGSVTTSGEQIYTGAVTLTSATTIATNSAKVTFTSTINSEGSETNNLTVTASETEFNGIIGGLRTIGVMDINGILDLNNTITAATSIDVSSTSDLGASVTTSSTQTYRGAVIISVNSTLTTTNSQITFSSTLDSDTGQSRNLTTSTGTSEVEFNAAVGGTDGLGVMDINGVLDLNTVITSATSIDVSGTSDFGASVTTSGAQLYQDDVIISADVTFTTTNGNVTFGGTVNSYYTSGTPTVKFYDNSNASGLLYTLTGTLSAVQNGGSCTFCNWGFNDRLTSFTLTAGGYLTLYQHGGLGGWSQVFDNSSGSSTVTYNLPYGSALNNDASSMTLSGGSASGDNYDLTVVTGNNNTVNFQDTVGGTHALANLNITGVLNLDAAISDASVLVVSSTSNLGHNVTTSGNQIYTGAVTISNDITLTTTDSNITFSSTVDGDGYCKRSNN